MRGRPPFVESMSVPDAIPGVEQQGWYQERVIHSVGWDFLGGVMVRTLSFQ